MSRPVGSRSRWFLRLSLRVRLMMIGVSGLAIALAAGSTILYTLLDITVNRTLDNEAAATADDVAALIGRGTPPDPLPISGAQVVQIVDSAHRVVDGSVNADRLTPLLHPDELARALTGMPVSVSGSRTGVSGPLRVSARAAGPASASVSIVVALQVSEIRRGLDVLRLALLISAPILLALLGLIAWYVIGWTLRPVEALRKGAQRISGTGQTERLQVPESADEIAALAVTLNEMLDRLSAARRRQRAFVADAAHELRSPLASIRVQLEVAERIGDGGDLAGELLADVERLSAVVEDLLLLARADDDARGPARPVVFDGLELIREIAAARPKSEVTIDVDDGPTIEVRADRGEIRRAIDNLVDNGVRHARARVLLSVATAPGEVVFGVIDDGPGIDPADRDRVFERFTRLDDARDRDAGGSGLGLSIVQEIVRRAGGRVTLAAATSDPAGAGLAARIHLPAKPPEGRQVR